MNEYIPNQHKQEETMADRKTAKQRAEEDLAIAKRVQAKAERRAAAATDDLETSTARYENLLAVKEKEAATATRSLKDANDRVKFLASHPALADDGDLL